MKPKEFVITINEGQRLFIIGNASGSTTLGFDICYERSVALADWLHLIRPSKDTIGTMASYTQFRDLIETCREHYLQTREKCPVELIPQLVGLEGKKVEVIDKHDEKRTFYVGKSQGWMPIHLELPTKGSQGGAGSYGAPFKSVRVIK